MNYFPTSSIFGEISNDALFFYSETQTSRMKLLLKQPNE